MNQSDKFIKLFAERMISDIKNIIKNANQREMNDLQEICESIIILHELLISNTPVKCNYYVYTMIRDFNYMSDDYEFTYNYENGTITIEEK